MAVERREAHIVHKIPRIAMRPARHEHQRMAADVSNSGFPCRSGPSAWERYYKLLLQVQQKLVIEFERLDRG
jgi:hypothetical protein